MYVFAPLKFFLVAILIWYPDTFLSFFHVTVNFFFPAFTFAVCFLTVTFLTGFTAGFVAVVVVDGFVAVVVVDGLSDLFVVKVNFALNSAYFEFLSVTFNVYCPGFTPVALYFNVPFSTLTFVKPSTAYSAT